ncbi:MAG: transcription elongation factor GreA [Planctomycetia bacterium]|nr:transcription elongation factor GreA [Planctomycetia bacterium]
MDDQVPMTKAGYEKLKAELRKLETVEEPKLQDRVGHARSEGDLNENAEYHGARESLGLLRAKINDLKLRLSKARIIDFSAQPRDQVGFGCTVVIKDLDFGDEETYTLVGAGEEDYDNGCILFTSPLAQGLAGKRAGERAEIAAPKGVMRFEIISIEYSS